MGALNRYQGPRQALETWKKTILCSNRGVSDPGTSKEASDEAAKVASKGLELLPGAVWTYHGIMVAVALK